MLKFCCCTVIFKIVLYKVYVNVFYELRYKLIIIKRHVLDMTLNCILVCDSITERVFAHQAFGPKRKNKNKTNKRAKH